MVFQLHLQNARDLSDEHTDWVCQSGDLQTSEECQAWLKLETERRPLPDGKMWLVMDETCDRFVRRPLAGKVTVHAQ